MSVDLVDLASRIAGEEEFNDVQMDADIAVALGHEVEFGSSRFTQQAVVAIAWKEPHNYAGMKEPCPRFSSSVDAAMTLLSCQFGDWKLEHFGCDVDGKWSAELRVPSGGGTGLVKSSKLKEGLPPARAILLAIFAAIALAGRLAPAD